SIPAKASIFRAPNIQRQTVRATGRFFCRRLYPNAGRMWYKIVLYVYVTVGSESALSLIVMKFGGSSVGTPERMQRVAKRIMERQREGNDIVVVVSAMGDTTDDLIDQSKQLNPNPPAREMDMLLSVGEQISIALLAMTLHQLGAGAVSFTGWQ